MHCPVVHFLNHMPTVRMLVGAVLALHTLVRAVPQEDDLERTMRWACSSVGQQVYAEAGSPPFKEYSYVREQWKPSRTLRRNVMAAGSAPA